MPDDDFLVVEDLDLGDESRLREIVALIEKTAASPGKALRVSVLTAEQWNTVVTRLLSKHLRRGMERHLYTLRDPGDPQHLLVSPSAVQGINEDSRMIYQDLVYAVLRCIPTELSESLRHGADDILAETISQNLAVDLFCRNFPEERETVEAVTAILSSQFGYSDLEWTVELRRSPEKVLVALSKSAFAPFWCDEIKRTTGQQKTPAALAREFAKSESDKRIFKETESALQLYRGERL